jgi:hypothetical protein
MTWETNDNGGPVRVWNRIDRQIMTDVIQEIQARQRRRHTFKQIALVVAFAAAWLLVGTLLVLAS